ncbi:MAG: hypothetical protein Q9170_005893 [Blastenia crenularia]
MASDNLADMEAEMKSAVIAGKSMTKSSNDDQALWKEKPSSRKAKTALKHSQDEKVMETNNSSIVSKRSVERLYYPKPHFFQYFVKRPLRRSPLINRGYWFRMHLIESKVLEFLSEFTKKHKIVVNLGCGYDPSPFRWISQKNKGTTFVDVDYPELMSKKRDLIMQHYEMEQLIQPLRNDNDDPVVLVSSDRYLALGCDLRDIPKLSKILDEKLQLASCLVLFVAEVSMTYMDVDAANAIIKWTAQYNDVRFCMLEQCLPDGVEHPFAQKMLQHFENLRSPLKCIREYPTQKDQELRFLKAGYHSAHARTLWDLWQDDSTFQIRDSRLKLNDVEPFDEWEEFALFSSHYFLLEAVKSPHTSVSDNKTSLLHAPQSSQRHFEADIRHENLKFRILSTPSNGRRRFGAITSFSDTTIGFHGGIGNAGRTQNTDRYQIAGGETQHKRVPDPPLSLPTRVCHTITRLHDGKELMIGGRNSPDEALCQCWLRFSDGWRPASDLPIPLYRHCATAVTTRENNEDGVVLVFGGRTKGGAAVKTWLLWQESKGWCPVDVLGGNNAECRFGATIVATHNRCGLMSGGMTEEGVLCDTTWEWKLTDLVADDPKIELKQPSNIQISPRMGACLLSSPVGIMLIGGISKSLLALKDEILCISDKAHSRTEDSREYCVRPVAVKFDGSRPLLVGHAAYAARNTVLIVGGGATDNLAGAHWNQDIWTIHCSADGENKDNAQRWVADKNAPLDARSRSETQKQDSIVPTTSSTKITEILRIKIETHQDFDRLMAEGKPFVMESLDIGPCTSCWTAEELAKKVDPHRMITVHQAQDDRMNFQHKNFSYVRKQFGEFVSEVSSGSKQYLRSLATDNPVDRPACFYEDFPSLRDDFHLPGQLETISRNHHSSPLRISGPVNMWLHYDVMANVLCQITGTKAMALYPPGDAVHFQIPPGSSTSPMNIWADETKGRGIITESRPCIRATLQAGDVLYIPPLWLHTASPLENLSVAINVFFKNYETGYAAGRDVYGNRNLQAYENGRKGIEKIVKAFDRLPRDVGSVYLERLAGELREKAMAYRSKGSLGES